jgi:excisionase family DNA binding protein
MNQATPSTLPGALAQRADVEMMTTEEAAAFLNCKPQTLNNWRITGRVRLPFVRVGRLIRYRKSDLEAFIASRTAGAVEA